MISPSKTDKETWWEWHKKNPHVYALFEKFSLQAIGSGRENFSHWLIMNRIRWETAITTTGDEFKIRNDFIAYYARLFMARHPEHDGFFRIKKMKADKV
jgi:hypothetical protein